jgi:outer membrane protein insertion porin family
LTCSVPGSAAAQAPPAIVDVRVEQEGQVVTDPQILNLVETKVGEPLSMADVRESINHLIGLDRFDDVPVYQEPAAGGIRLRYVLMPLHPIDRLAFRGTTGIDADELRRIVTQRFGVAPAASRADAVIELLQATYHARGYAEPMISSHVEPTHMPDRATLVFDVNAGMRLAVKDVTFDQVDPRERAVLSGLAPLRTGRPYDADAIDKQLQQYVDGLHTRGYYEARASHTVDFQAGGAVVMVQVVRGPKVTVKFEGDPLPIKDLDRLVPIKAEGSADEDLLEDSQNAIEDYLRTSGYRDARAPYTEDEQGDELTITYKIERGVRYTVSQAALEGNMALTPADLQPALRIKGGDPFVQSAVDATVAAVTNLYRTRGFTRATVRSLPEVLPAEVPDARVRQVRVKFTIAEGPKTTVHGVTFTGNTAIQESVLRAAVMTTAGTPFTQSSLTLDRDRLELEYWNRGYESVVVQPDPILSDDATQADVRFTISEGPQIIVDHVIIVGNERTSAATIEHELLLKPGEPLGYSARLESQQRLAALGLFRRVRIDALQHAGEVRRDVRVEVEEAPPRTIAWGGGIEVGQRLATNEAGLAVEQYEFVPRASFEITRRNLWGKNRSVTLFSRAALRSQELTTSDAGSPLLPAADTSQGFNEYRVYATYREPRAFGTKADVLLTGLTEQAIRSSFNYRTRLVRAESGLRLSKEYSFAGRYSLERTELFDENISDADKPLVDRLFPQVRLSKFSGTFVRDTRNDPLDPSSGRWFIVDADVAAKVIGSQVGFDKVYGQAFSFTRLPTERRMILALGARLGLAHGFPYEVAGVVIPAEARLPASERFFAGGDTTVRGFALDRLGDQKTITTSGFPTGGNSVLILNTELRVNTSPRLQVVGFVDAGNVFQRVGDLSLTDIRGSYGGGVRYNFPFIGNVRFDYGIKMNRLELVPGELESRGALHISLSQAF